MFALTALLWFIMRINYGVNSIGWNYYLLSMVGGGAMCMYCVGNFSPAMGARNQVGIVLSYRPASQCSLATQFQTRFLESIPRPIAGHKFPTLLGFTKESIPAFIL
jgi:hypothetical protein